MGLDLLLTLELFCYIYIEFFISLRAAITSTGLDFPVTFWISGSCILVSKCMRCVYEFRGKGWLAYVDAHEHIVELFPLSVMLMNKRMLL